jgi:hypothetical protein
MLTIEEIESACSSTRLVKLPRNFVEPPDFPFEETYFPYGFPVTVRTNSELVLEQYRQLWGRFTLLRDTDPINVDVQLVPSESRECPPEPTYRMMMSLLTAVADRDNYSVVDLDRCQVTITISEAALAHPLYLQYFLLGSPVCIVSTALATPVHAGCVALEGRGALLCGDSGAGKSSLSYACASNGWTYVSDDGSFLLNGGTERMVTGDCYKVRFRPSAAALFPELEGLQLTPRAAGKPSIEVPTASMPGIECSQTTRVEYIVFLNRRAGGAQELVPYQKDVARQFMRQQLFGSAASKATQYAAIERLLTTNIYELRYNSMSWAVDRLRMLVEEGR